MFLGLSDGDNEKILSLLHDLESQGETHFCMAFRLQTWYTLDLGVNSSIFEVEDIINVEKNTDLKVERIHFMTFLDSDCIHAADLILV